MTGAGPEVMVALWYDASQESDPVGSCSNSIGESLVRICRMQQLTCGEVSYTLLEPGNDRVPSVPRWLERIKGAVPRLLVATAQTVALPEQKSWRLVGDLDRKDLARLRAITRRQHAKALPNATPLTDLECDAIIDQLGSEVILEQLRSSTVH